MKILIGKGTEDPMKTLSALSYIMLESRRVYKHKMNQKTALI